MLKKDEMVPGTIVQIKDVIKDGLTSPIFGKRPQETLPCVRMWAGGIGPLTSRMVPVLSGELVTVVRKPRRVENINVIEIEYAGQTGYVYWCELRVSGKKVEKTEKSC